MSTSIESLLQTAMKRHLSSGDVTGVMRLTGGATMESWRFEADGELYVLRRAPSLEFMTERPFGHDTEAAIIRAAHACGVIAPEVIAEMTPEDGLGSGFVMRALPGTPDPRAILAMENPGQILSQAARNLARIHTIKPEAIPSDVPQLEYADGIAGFRAQFKEAGGDRPIIALGLKWLADNLPEPVDPVLNHGDFRLGNILAEDSQLTGVLDWELAHFGDPHEDLAFGCMAVWRFARYDRPALGLGSLEDYFSAYEAESGAKINRARFRFWSIYRTVWWALGCLRMAKTWRSGEDRMLERVVISRRTSEQELDLLMLLADEVSGGDVAEASVLPDAPPISGEASNGEIATAISEWLATIKDKVEGHDRFQLAVARNALGMIARDDAAAPRSRDIQLSEEIARGYKGLNSPNLLARLKRDALDKLSADIPKYPALAVARKKWTGED